MNEELGQARRGKLKEHLFAALCPWCGAEHDLASGTDRTDSDQSGPKEGNLSICIVCGEISEYQKVSKRRLALVKPLPEKLAEYRNDPWVQRVRTAWALAMITHGPPKRKRRIPS